MRRSTLLRLALGAGCLVVATPTLSGQMPPTPVVETPVIWKRPGEVILPAAPPVVEVIPTSASREPAAPAIALPRFNGYIDPTHVIGPRDSSPVPAAVPPVVPPLVLPPAPVNVSQPIWKPSVPRSAPATPVRLATPSPLSGPYTPVGQRAGAARYGWWQ